MKKLFVIGILLLAFISSTIAQKVNSGKSKPTRIVPKPKLKRDLPPNLFVDLSYEYGNKNGILDPNETTYLKLKIINNSKGPAQSIIITINEGTFNSEFILKNGQKISHLYPDQSNAVKIPFKADFNVQTKDNKLEIIAGESFGYDLGPAYLLLNTIAYQESKLIFSGLELFDIGSGTAAINVNLDQKKDFNHYFNK